MLKLTFACHDYDHVRDIFEPEVVTEGVELTQLKLPVEEIFFRFIKFGEFEISEHSFAKYVSLRSKGRPAGSRSQSSRRECSATQLFMFGPNQT